MHTTKILFLLPLIWLLACKKVAEQQPAGFNHQNTSPSEEETELFAVTREDYLQYGADIAYLNAQGDTVIDFGQFAYFGTDTLTHFAQVLLRSDDGSYEKGVGINPKGEILFDLVMYDNGPDVFSEGLVRVLRNDKMGFANDKGKIVIDCQYDFAYRFENGIAKVTKDARFAREGEYTSVASDQWFYIDRQGERIGVKNEKR